MKKEKSKLKMPDKDGWQSYLFLGHDGLRWHTQVHITHQFLSDFIIRLEKIRQALLMNPGYDVPNPFDESKTVKIEDDNDKTRYIG